MKTKETSQCYQIQNNKEMFLFVIIQPNSSKSEFYTLHDNKLKIKIKSPPVDGKANEALIDLIAKTFKIKKRQVEITRGHTDKFKTLLIHDDDIQSIEHKLLGLLNSMTS